MLFNEVVGQIDLKSRMIEEINSGKMSHAQLFLGKNGYGNLALALAYTQFLFCKNRGETDACGECASCSKTRQLIHPDVHFVFPTVQAISKVSDGFINEWRETVLSSPYFNLNDWLNVIDVKGRRPIIGTEESKDLLKKLSLMSYEGGYKVVIIWMAEEMNPTFANKMLKTLEEPSDKTILLILAESTEYILPTIMSRTQVRKIPRLSFAEVSHYVQMNTHLSENESQSLVARVEGDISLIRAHLINAENENKNREMFILLMRSAYKKNVLEMMDWADQISGLGREAQKIFLEYALHMFRQSILKNYTEEQLIRVSREEGDFLKNFSRFITGNNVGEFLEVFSEAHYHIERNANPKILFTHLAFRAMRFIHFA
jgi:DNA polymerase III subunit delta'